jgi:hypothetical protein
LLELVESDARPWVPAPIGEAHEGNGKVEKVRLAALRPDAEVGPVMKLFDDTLSGVLEPEPPMRDVEGWPVEIQCRETAGLHELTPEGANDEEDEKSRLPPPKNLLLTKHDAESLEILIGDYIEFTNKTKAGGRAVAAALKIRSTLFEVPAIEIAALPCRADNAAGLA